MIKKTTTFELFPGSIRDTNVTIVYDHNMLVSNKHKIIIDNASGSTVDTYFTVCTHIILDWDLTDDRDNRLPILKDTFYKLLPFTIIQRIMLHLLSLDQ